MYGHHTNKTARQHCADRHCKCFPDCKDTRDRARWRKCCGYIVAEYRGYVKNCHIFAIEIHDDTPVICRYTIKNTRDFEANLISYRYLQNIIKSNKLSSEEISFDEMIDSVSSVYHDIYKPQQREFCLEYGILYNKNTDTMHNYIGAIDG